MASRRAKASRASRASRASLARVGREVTGDALEALGVLGVLGVVDEHRRTTGTELPSYRVTELPSYRVTELHRTDTFSRSSWGGVAAARNALTIAYPGNSFSHSHTVSK